MTVKELIHRIVDRLGEEESEDLLDYLNLQVDPDVLSPEEEALVAEGDDAFDRADSVTLQEFDSKHGL